MELNTLKGDMETQDLINNAIVTFQGKEIKLKDIIDDESIKFLKGDIIAKIFRKEQIVIGDAMSDENFEKIKHAYVDRRLSEIKPLDLFNNYEITWNRKYTNAILTVSTFEDVKADTVLLISEPETGKSSLLTHLSLNTKELSRDLWIVRINLLDHAKVFQKWQQDNTPIDTLKILEFICQVISKNNQPVYFKVIDDKVYLKESNLDEFAVFEVNMFLNFYNKGKTILLIDGFDEICPYYKETALQFVKEARNLRVNKLWVTTRPYNNILEDLKDIFDKTYELEYLNDEEQRFYLNEVWKSILKVTEINNNLLDKVKSYLDHGWHKKRQCVDAFDEKMNFRFRKIIYHFHKYLNYNFPHHEAYESDRDSCDTELSDYENESDTNSSETESDIYANDTERETLDNDLNINAINTRTDSINMADDSARKCENTNDSDTELNYQTNHIKINDNNKKINTTNTPNSTKNTDILAKAFETRIVDKLMGTPSFLYSVAGYLVNVLNDTVNPDWDKDINILSFYEIFIENKLKKGFQTQKKVTDNLLYENERSETLILYKKLATYAVFGYPLKFEDVSLVEFKDLLFKDDSEMKVMIDKIKSGTDKTGIITHVVNDNKPAFIRTFGEYFAAQYICDIYKDSDIDFGVKKLLYVTFEVCHQYYDMVPAWISQIRKKDEKLNDILNKIYGDLPFVKNRYNSSRESYIRDFFNRGSWSNEFLIRLLNSSFEDYETGCFNDYDKDSFFNVVLKKGVDRENVKNEFAKHVLIKMKPHLKRHFVDIK